MEMFCRYVNCSIWLAFNVIYYMHIIIISFQLNFLHVKQLRSSKQKKRALLSARKIHIFRRSDANFSTSWNFGLCFGPRRGMAGFRRLIVLWGTVEWWDLTCSSGGDRGASQYNINRANNRNTFIKTWPKRQVDVLSFPC